jgi:hypothetical protein
LTIKIFIHDSRPELFHKIDSRNRPPVYCPELGLCIEKIKDGFTLESLWQILPPESAKRNLLD